MAAAISIHNMLQRMGLIVEAATEVVNVNGQNLSVLDEFLQLEDKDVETLCRVIRWPGGVNAAGNRLWQRRTSSACVMSCVITLVFHAQLSGLTSRC